MKINDDSRHSPVGFLLDNNFDGIIVIKKGKVEFANTRFTDLSGFLTDDIVSNNDLMITIFEEDITTRISEIGPDDEIGPISSMINTKNGSTTPVDISIWSDVEGLMKIMTIRPILDEDRLKSYLRESEDKFRTLVQNLPGVVYLYDQYPDGSRRRHFYGQDLKRMLGQIDGADVSDDIDKFFNLIPAEDISRLQKESELAEKTGGILDIEYPLVLEGGRTIWVRSIGRPLRLDNGIIRWQGVILDVTEKKVIEDRLIMEKERAEFYLDLLTHDLGNMHQGISSWIELGISSNDNEKRKKMAFNRAQSLLKSSMKMVRNLLLLNRIKEREPDLKNIKVRPLVDEAFKEVEGIFLPRNIDYWVEDLAPDVEVLGEPLLKEAFFNIIHNGVKFQTDENAIISSRISRTKDGNVKIEIADHGPGIPDRIKRSVFDRQFHASRKVRSGIGLSIVKELVSKYNGEVKVEDRVEGEIGQGSRFIITLPCY